jgi:hypothetical protein
VLFIEGTNGGAVEIIGDSPFMLSLVEAFKGFFSRIEGGQVGTIGSLFGSRQKNLVPLLVIRVTESFYH